MGKSLEIVNSDNYWTYEAAAYYLPQKGVLFFAFFYKFVLISFFYLSC